MILNLTDEQIAIIKGDIQEANHDYKDNPTISSPRDARAVLDDLKSYKKEHFILLTLDSANRLINRHTITIGTLTASLVHPREVFKPAIQDCACSIIVAHNHPSGNLEQSHADDAVTKRLKKAGELLGIQLIDHLLIAGEEIKSILQERRD